MWGRFGHTLFPNLTAVHIETDGPPKMPVPVAPIERMIDATPFDLPVMPSLNLGGNVDHAGGDFKGVVLMPAIQKDMLP